MDLNALPPSLNETKPCLKYSRMATNNLLIGDVQGAINHLYDAIAALQDPEPQAPQTDAPQTETPQTTTTQATTTQTEIPQVD